MSTICQIYTSWTTKNIPKTVVIAFLTAGQIRVASRLAKADNIVFPLTDETIGHISNLKSAIGREFGNRKKDGSWEELPNVYYLYDNALVGVWVK